MLIPSVAVSAVDTTAAGDAFNGGLAWARLRIAAEGGRPSGVPGRALSATRLGAQPSLPTKDQLLQFIKDHRVL